MRLRQRLSCLQIFIYITYVHAQNVHPTGNHLDGSWKAFMCRDILFGVICAGTIVWSLQKLPALLWFPISNIIKSVAVCRNIASFQCIKRNQKCMPIEYNEYLHYVSRNYVTLYMAPCIFVNARAGKNLGAVSIRKTVLPGMAIPMLKIRRPNGRLIFNMEIAIRR